MVEVALDLLVWLFIGLFWVFVGEENFILDIEGVGVILLKL